MNAIKLNLICLRHIFISFPGWTPAWLFPNKYLDLIVAKGASNCIRLEKHLETEPQIRFWQVNDVLS